MSRCVCPGSFDPITHGHLDVIARSQQIFDDVVVAIVANPDKTARFDADTRLEAVRQSVPRGVSVHVAEGLLVDFCARVQATVIVKGLRSVADVPSESAMAQLNRDLTGIETLLLPCHPRWQHVSSSLVVQIARLGGDISQYVPPAVHKLLRQA